MNKRYDNLQYSDTPQETLVEISDASLSIDDQMLLQNINLRVNRGDFVYLIGRVGSGKSSLLKTIYAELELDEGEAHVFDYDLMHFKRKHIPELRRQMGIVFQDFALLRRMTVNQNLDFVLRATDWRDKTARQERIEEVLTLVGLADRGDSFPHELSGGEKQRVAIARALLNHPSLILADEPTGNLDAETARAILSILYDLHEKGTTVIIITHNMSHLKHFPGRVYECADGTIREIVKERNVNESINDKPVQ